MPLINCEVITYSSLRPEISNIMTDDSNNIQSALAAGSALATPHTLTQPAGLEGVPFVVTPQGYQVTTLGHTLAHPVRKKAQLMFSELPSFARYLEQHATPATVIFAHFNGLHQSGLQRPRYTAVIKKGEMWAYRAMLFANEVADTKPFILNLYFRPVAQ